MNIKVRKFDSNQLIDNICLELIKHYRKVNTLQRKLEYDGDLCQDDWVILESSRTIVLTLSELITK